MSLHREVGPFLFVLPTMRGLTYRHLIAIHLFDVGRGAMPTFLSLQTQQTLAAPIGICHNPFFFAFQSQLFT